MINWDGEKYVEDATGKEVIQVSFSGGRTSAYMTYRLLESYSDRFCFVVTFANTGREHPKTLEFVRNCDALFLFPTVWLEAEVRHGERRSSGHRVVTFETADRAGRVFEEYIKKYGVPNTSFPQCTRELKLNPMKSYLKSLGVDVTKIKTAIGIREDESRRVSVEREKNSIIYPLIDWFPTDKAAVLDFWRAQPFDLGIEEFEGNCLACYKKSRNKLFLQIKKDPSVFDFTRRMEDLYSEVGPQNGRRVFFRGNLDTRGLFALFELVGNSSRRTPGADEDGGCSESCEAYPTEVLGK